MFERFFWDDDGTLTDQTKEWSDPHSNTALWDGKSYLYISSYLPFNHKYFDIDVANDQDGTLAIEIWYNGDWRAVSDIIDFSDKLTASGNIVFTIDDTYGWTNESDSSDIDELSTTKVYDAYWARITLACATDSALKLNYIGYKFAEDSDLLIKYPMLRNQSLKTAFETGKTDWKDQLIIASQFIISDLKSRNLVFSKDQLLDIHRFKDACCYKAAEMIFGGLGEKWFDYVIKAQERYKEDMNMDNYGIDQNADSVLSRSESTVRIRRLSR